VVVGAVASALVNSADVWVGCNGCLWGCTLAIGIDTGAAVVVEAITVPDVVVAREATTARNFIES
jgi:hypothetical protein